MNPQIKCCLQLKHSDSYMTSEHLLFCCMCANCNILDLIDMWPIQVNPRRTSFNQFYNAMNQKYITCISMGPVPHYCRPCVSQAWLIADRLFSVDHVRQPCQPWDIIMDLVTWSQITDNHGWVMLVVMLVVWSYVTNNKDCYATITTLRLRCLNVEFWSAVAGFEVRLLIPEFFIIRYPTNRFVFPGFYSLPECFILIEEIQENLQNMQCIVII